MMLSSPATRSSPCSNPVGDLQCPSLVPLPAIGSLTKLSPRGFCARSIAKFVLFLFISPRSVVHGWRSNYCQQTWSFFMITPFATGFNRLAEGLFRCSLHNSSDLIRIWPGFCIPHGATVILPQRGCNQVHGQFCISNQEKD